jgi:hypothetical protein
MKLILTEATCLVKELLGKSTKSSGAKMGYNALGNFS